MFEGKKGQGPPQELSESSEGGEMPVDGTQICSTTPELAGSPNGGALQAPVCKLRAEIPADRRSGGLEDLMVSEVLCHSTQGSQAAEDQESCRWHPGSWSSHGAHWHMTRVDTFFHCNLDIFPLHLRLPGHFPPHPITSLKTMGGNKECSFITDFKQGYIRAA